MSAIAGMAGTGKQDIVHSMLEKMAHRGLAGSHVIEKDGFTLGLSWTQAQSSDRQIIVKEGIVRDYAGDGRFAEALIKDGWLTLQRDALGAAPLYVGRTADGSNCFASEVKAMVGLATSVREMPPGATWVDGNISIPASLKPGQTTTVPAPGISGRLRHLLEQSVQASLSMGECGAWLSGGLDSSALVALARPHMPRMHTFAAGLPGAPDLEFARQMADYIHSDHHEIILQVADLLAALPEVIFALESFDALLVRSSLTNYLAAREAARYVPAVLSGEGGDELFAGYAYLKEMDISAIPAELLDITGRLHNTALQRVDRCSMAAGILAHTPFLNPGVVKYAITIPAAYKLHLGIEKWILRLAVADLLPPEILNRTKSKFWEGAGVGDHLARHATATISGAEFQAERRLPNGWLLNTREELLYYRIFREFFGSLTDLDWMGRTKGAPVENLAYNS